MKSSIGSNSELIHFLTRPNNTMLWCMNSINKELFFSTLISLSSLGIFLYIFLSFYSFSDTTSSWCFPHSIDTLVLLAFVVSFHIFSCRSSFSIHLVIINHMACSSSINRQNLYWPFQTITHPFSFLNVSHSPRSMRDGRIRNLWKQRRIAKQHITRPFCHPIKWCFPLQHGETVGHKKFIDKVKVRYSNRGTMHGDMQRGNWMTKKGSEVTNQYRVKTP